MNITQGEGGETALFTSKQGPVTGCSRLQTAGEPENSSINAAKSDPGQMFVEGQPISINEQKGGMGYSVDLNQVSASPKGQIAGHNKYTNDNLRSDLNKYDPLPIMSAGAKKNSKKTNKKTQKYKSKLKKFRKTANRFTSRNLKRINKLQKNIRSTARKNIKKLKKNISFKKVRINLPVPVYNKKGGKYNKHKKLKTFKKFKKHSYRKNKIIMNKGKRAPFFNYGGNKDNVVDKRYQDIDSDHKGNLFYGGSCGSYHGQSVNNVPLSFGHSVGGDDLPSSALASPPPHKSYSVCQN